MPPNGAASQLEFVAELLRDRAAARATPSRDDFGTDAVARDDRDVRFHFAAFIGAPARTRKSASVCESRKPSSSTPFSRQYRAKASSGNLTAVPSGSVSVVARDVDVDLGAGVREQPGVRRLVDEHRQQAVLQAVGAEDVRELGADHGVEAEVLQRPRRVLARGAAAEVAAGDQDARSPAASGWFSTKSGFGLPAAS